MKKHFWLILLPLLVLGCKRDAGFDPTLSSNPLVSAQDLAVDQLVSDYKDRINTVGLTIGILHNDSVFVYGYGETKAGNGVTPDGHTFFEMGSLTKIFTAIATQRFLDDRGLSANAFVNDFLPADIPSLEKEGKKVTLLHLITHTSGLPYMPDNMGPNLVLNIDKAWREYDTLKLYKCLRGVALEFTPESKWKYSNLAVGTLGTILERNEGKSYGQIIQDEIAGPLGLTETKATLSSAEMTRMADGHKGGKKVDFWTDLNAMNGAGVLRSTILDLLEFGRINLDPPATPLGQSMLTCQQPTLARQAVVQDTLIQMGQGWLIQTTAAIQQPFLYHNGGTGGFQTEFMVFPEDNAVLAISFNSLTTTKDQNEARNDFLLALAELASGN